MTEAEKRRQEFDELKEESEISSQIERQESDSKELGESKWGSFKAFSKKISQIYKSDDGLALRTDHSEVSQRIFNVTTKALLKSTIRNRI